MDGGAIGLSETLEEPRFRCYYKRGGMEMRLENNMCGFPEAQVWTRSCRRARLRRDCSMEEVVRG